MTLEYKIMSEILKAIRQICEEKGLSYEAVIETVESALAAAYRKDYGKKIKILKWSLIQRPANQKFTT